MPPVIQGNSPMVNPAFATIDKGRPEGFTQPLYDRVNVATTVPGSLSLFAIQVGGTATVIRGGTATSGAKTKRDTNLDLAGSTGSKAYEIRGIALAIIHGTGNLATNQADRNLVIENGYLTMITGGSKTVFECPLVTIPFVNPAYALADVGSAAKVFGTNGPNSSMFPFKTPITLDENTTFSVTITFDITNAIALTTTLDIQAFLYGNMLRGT